MFYHIFSFDVQVDDNLNPKLTLDCFYVNEFPDNMTETSFKVANRIDPKYGNGFAQAINGMMLRTRFANTPNGFDGLYLLKSEHKLSRDDVECVVESKRVDGVLRDFINESRFVI